MKVFLFKVRTACPECGESLILDGPIRAIRCNACQSSLQIGPKEWKRILDARSMDDVKRRVGSVVLGFASEYTFHARVGPEQPKCTACGKQIDITGVAPGTDGQIACACGQTMTTHPAPDWLREIEPKAAQLFGAVREERNQDESPVVTPQANRPVSFGCPDCGANLKITVETPRILECHYCKADLFLPDPLWRALHPVRKRTAWYVAFK